LSAPETDSAELAARDRLLRPVLARLLGAVGTPRSLLARSSLACWLLSVAHLSARLEGITGCLDALQDTFLGLLMDATPLTQRVAARGLGVCYDAGDEACSDGGPFFFHFLIRFDFFY
jgi:hypothetical protein